MLVAHLSDMLSNLSTQECVLLTSNLSNKKCYSSIMNCAPLCLPTILTTTQLLQKSQQRFRGWSAKPSACHEKEYILQTRVVSPALDSGSATRAVTMKEVWNLCKESWILVIT